MAELALAEGASLADVGADLARARRKLG